MNAQALKHPRTIAEIDSAMRRAAEYSRNSSSGIGQAVAISETFRPILGVLHDRNAIPAFSFHRKGQNITAQVLAVLRGEK